jgi:L-alanine-DL-glutamate epimerase-like enolase superfamily enzyme
MEINRVTTFILHVPLSRGGIADSTHHLTHWGVPGVRIETAEGIVGYGFTGTHADLATDRQITSFIRQSLAEMLVGADAHSVTHLWQEMYQCPHLLWVGRGSIPHLALAAVDIALWDLKAKSVGLPLWRLLGGSSGKKITAYNTDAGWLNLSTTALVEQVKHLVDDEGFGAIKIKVGSDDPAVDLERVACVRESVGPSIGLMVDANGRWDLPTAMSFGCRLSDHGVRWFEEPIWYDDVHGHARLATHIDTPIALGEQLYRLDDFRNFLHAGAVHYVQPDCTRLRGVTEWWQVADLAHAYRLPVVSHVGDMMQVHQHLAIAHPACTMIEYIPWLRHCMVEPATVEHGVLEAPLAPGAGTEIRDDALAEFGVESE